MDPSFAYILNHRDRERFRIVCVKKGGTKKEEMWWSWGLDFSF